jgi:hypothetical protein
MRVGLRAAVLSQLAMQVAAAVQIAPRRRTVGNIERSNPTYRSAIYRPGPETLVSGGAAYGQELARSRN